MAQRLIQRFECKDTDLGDYVCEFQSLLPKLLVFIPKFGCETGGAASERRWHNRHTPHTMDCMRALYHITGSADTAHTRFSERDQQLTV
jgi:hypothetical protein